jgi:peptidyl-prolyl cis-trans isomerase SurA
MKKIFAICLCISAAAAPRVRSQQVLDQIAAVVDNNIILSSELLQYTRQLAVQLAINPAKEPEKFEELRRNTLDNMVIQKVLLTKAKEDSITVDDRQVDQTLDEQINRMVQQLGSEEKLEEYFGQPLRKIRRTLRQEIADRMLVETLQSKKVREVRISRREVEEFYHVRKDSLPRLKASVKLSHILFTIEAGDEAQKKARALIDSLLSLVRAGEDFATLARNYSEDPGSKDKGGELGFIQRGDFVKEFEEAAFALKPGEISDVVKSQFGLHIVQLIDRRGEKINARHILIRLTTTVDDESAVQQKAKDLREKILGGTVAFADAAREHSQDKTTSANGGDLGWFEVDQLQLPAFRQAIEALRVNEISEPVKTQFGYHVLRLDGRRDARSMSFDEDYEQIHEMALYSKREREFAAWVQSLKKHLYIRINEQS